MELEESRDAASTGGVEEAAQKRLMTLVFTVLALMLAGLIVLVLFLTGRAEPGYAFRANGFELKWIRSVRGPGQGNRPRFDRPLGVATAKDGTVFVADSGNDRICVFSPDGEFLREWGGHGIAKPARGARATWEPGLLNYPVGVDVGDDGLVYVADFRNDQICVFKQDGTFVRAFPSPRTSTGMGSSGQDGTGIAVTDVAARDGFVYATDTYQVFVFTDRGKFVRQFGKPGSGLTDLDHPAGVAADGGGVYVSDSNHQRLTAFSKTGDPRWSTKRSTETSAGARSKKGLVLPRGLALNDDGRIIVADAFGQSLVIFDDDGRQITKLGERGTSAGRFNFPADVAWVGDRIVVADKENNRVQLFQLNGDKATAGK